MKRKRGLTAEIGKQQQGSSIVEFALLLPLLTTLLLGTVDFSRLFYQGIVVSSAALVGAQYGTQRASRSTDLEGIEAVAQAEAADLEGVTVQAEQYCECSGGGLIDCTASCGGVSPEVYVRVTVQKTFQTLFSYYGIPSSIDISREALLRAR